MVKNLFNNLIKSNNSIFVLFSMLDIPIEGHEKLQMLRSCYNYAFYSQICQNRGELKAKVLYNRAMQVHSFNVLFLIDILRCFFFRFLSF